VIFEIRGCEAVLGVDEMAPPIFLFAERCPRFTCHVPEGSAASRRATRTGNYHGLDFGGIRGEHGGWIYRRIRRGILDRLRGRARAIQLGTAGYIGVCTRPGSVAETLLIVSGIGGSNLLIARHASAQ